MKKIKTCNVRLTDIKWRQNKRKFPPAYTHELLYTAHSIRTHIHRNGTEWSGGAQYFNLFNAFSFRVLCVRLQLHTFWSDSGYNIYPFWNDEYTTIYTSFNIIFFFFRCFVAYLIRAYHNIKHKEVGFGYSWITMQYWVIAIDVHRVSWLRMNKSRFRLKW